MINIHAKYVINYLEKFVTIFEKFQNDRKHAALLFKIGMTRQQYLAYCEQLCDELKIARKNCNHDNIFMHINTHHYCLECNKQILIRHKI